MQQELRQLPQETLPSSGVGGGKVRGSISLAVTAGIVGTGRVGGDCGDCGGGMQKPLFRVGENLYWGAYLSSPKVAEMEEAPVGLQTRLAWEWAEYHGGGWLAWLPHQQ